MNTLLFVAISKARLASKIREMTQGQPAAAAIKRIDPPQSADERTMLLAFLDYYRATIQRQTAGLDADQLAASLPPSDLTLGGMLKHLAYVEDWWLGAMLAGQSPTAPFDNDSSWESDPDWDWHSAADDEPEELRTLLTDAIARSDAHLADLDSLDATTSVPSHVTGKPFTLRWILIHLIEEYARHVGHADFIRQSIDGATDL